MVFFIFAFLLGSIDLGVTIELEERLQYVRQTIIGKDDVPISLREKKNVYKRKRYLRRETI